jgi:four helix bundle protein
MNNFAGEGRTEIRLHKELDVWRVSMQLAKNIYRLVDHFPKKEEFRMTSQVVRAAISIPANIAEGNSRGSRRDYAHFVSIARGSAAELETLLLLAKEVGLAPENEFGQITEQTERVGRMLTSLRRRLSSPSPESRTPSPQQ